MSTSERKQSAREAEKANSSFSGKRAGLALIGFVLLVVSVWLVWNSWQPTRTLDEAVSLEQPIAKIATDAEANTPETMASNTIGSELGQNAPNFTIPTLDGSTFTLADHQGKPSIIFFMAYWCGSCIPEARALARLQQEYGDEVSIVALDVDPNSTPQLLEPFKDAADGAAYTWAFDTNQQVTLAYEVKALDTTLVLDNAGRVVYRDAFPTTYEQLKTVFEQLGL